jgi:hypothetical protein
VIGRCFLGENGGYVAWGKGRKEVSPSLKRKEGKKDGETSFLAAVLILHPTLASLHLPLYAQFSLTGKRLLLVCFIAHVLGLIKRTVLENCSSELEAKI